MKDVIGNSAEEASKTMFTKDLNEQSGVALKQLVEPWRQG